MSSLRRGTLPFPGTALNLPPPTGRKPPRPSKCQAAGVSHHPNCHLNSNCLAPAGSVICCFIRMPLYGSQGRRKEELPGHSMLLSTALQGIPLCPRASPPGMEDRSTRLLPSSLLRVTLPALHKIPSFLTFYDFLFSLPFKKYFFSFLLFHILPCLHKHWKQCSHTKYSIIYHNFNQSTIVGHLSCFTFFTI